MRSKEEIIKAIEELEKDNRLKCELASVYVDVILSFVQLNGHTNHQALLWCLGIDGYTQWTTLQELKEAQS